ncbi:MAG TPA: asparagine synthase-related protein, partial [Bryobacteraceae bacterium]|nr:asparagine synthase-related protein [Bryobacteraceae bacterium]
MPDNSVAPIAVAMSGGVDSSVVAGLLQRQGASVVGLTMQLWNQRRLPELIPEGGAVGRCCSLDDVYDARFVASILGIPYYVVNFEERFEEQVVKPFVEDYL